MKSNSVMDKTVLGAVITWTFSQKEGALSPLVADVSKWTPAIQEECKMLGAGSKIGDAAAKNKDKVTGKSVPIAEKRAAMEKVLTALNAGEWRGEREMADTVLFQALVAVYPNQTPEKLREYLSGKSAAEKVTLAATVEPVNIKAAIEKINAIKIATVDTKPMLDELAALMDPDLAARKAQHAAANKKK